MNKLAILFLLATASFAQTPKTPLLVTQVRLTPTFAAECGGVAVCLDNRSTFLRRNNYHSFSATGTGTWSVTMDFTDASTPGSPWTSFGSTAVVNQASNPNIGFGLGYHNFIHFTITGPNAATVVIQYSGETNFFISTSVAGITFPILIPSGGTGATTAAGALANLGWPVESVSNYTFTVQSCNGSNSCSVGGASGSVLFSATPSTLTLNPCPVGVNGADTAHQLWISGGTGSAEAVTITGGTCTSGAGSGTVIFTPANNHSGAWTIGTATGYIQEAICALSGASGDVLIPSGSYALNGNASFCGKTAVRLLIQPGVTFTGTGSLPSGDGKNLVWYPNVNTTGRVGTVIVYPPAVQDGVGVPVAPDGHLISTVGSTTSGIQEGFNYALAHGHTFRIEGGDDLQPGCHHSGPGPGPGCGATVYQVFTPGGLPGINFSPTQGMDIFAGPITINCNGAVTGACVRIDSQEMTVFDWRGAQIVQSGSGPALQLYGTGNTPLDNIQGIIPFRLYISSTVITTTDTGHINVDLATGNGILSTWLQIDEINGGDVGIRVFPSASSFAHNIIIAKFIHGQILGANPIVTIGTAGSLALNNNIYQNEWHLGVLEIASGKRVYDLFESNDTLWLGLDFMPTSGASGIFLESGSGYAANYNQIFTQATYLGDGPVCGTTVQCAVVANNHINRVHKPAIGSISVTASPFVYQNQDFATEKIIVTPGTAAISDISLSGDGTTFTTTGTIVGMYVLEAGESIQVTYGAGTPPTIKKIL